MPTSDQLIPNNAGNFQAKPDGLWNYTIDPTTVEPGYHQVQVTDELGQEYEAGLYIEPKAKTDQAPMFVVQESVSVIDRVRSAVPEWTGTIVFILFLIVLLIGATGIRQGLRARHAVEETNPTQHVKWRLALGGIVFWIAVAVVIVAALGMTTQTFAPLRSRVMAPFVAKTEAPAPIAVSGRLVHPREKTAVVGVDLQVDDMSIRTQEGGRFQFPEVFVDEGVRITHPALMRAVQWMPAGAVSNVDLPFDVALLNAVILRTDAEARGNAERLAGLFATSIRTAVAASGSTVRFPSPIFTSADTLNQELVMRGITLHATETDELIRAPWSDVVRVELIRDQATIGWDLVYEDGTWKFIR